MKTYIHLTQFDRTLIAYLLQQNMSLSQIAYQLKRSKSTVSSEIRRNSNKTGYNPETADKRALARRHKTCVLDQNQSLQAYVIDRLREGHSPELIAVRLKRYPEPGIPYISHNAIYDWLYKPHQIKQRLYKLLRQGKRTRGRRKRTHRSLIQQRVAIEERPQHIADRIEAGHWEADLISFRQNTQYILVLNERKTRYTATIKLQNKTAEHTFQQIAGFLRGLPKHLRRTMTFDNGLEFARHYKLNDMFQMQTYFCDVYASWQKGSIENMNGRLRCDLPRKTDLTQLSDADLEAIMINHNLTPRKVLKGQTPIEALAQELGHAIVLSFSRSVLLQT